MKTKQIKKRKKGRCNRKEEATSDERRAKVLFLKMICYDIGLPSYNDVRGN